MNKSKLTIRPDILSSVPGIFGEKQVNGKTINVQHLIQILTENYAPAFQHVLKERQTYQRLVAEGKNRYQFADPASRIEDPDGNALTATDIRQGMIDSALDRKSRFAWKLNSKVPVPELVRKPGLQGTGPADDMGMLISAINTGSASWMFDWEDAGNDFQNKLYRAWKNLTEVLSGQWNGKVFHHPIKKKDYKLNLDRAKWGSLFHRVPGLHLKSRQIFLNGAAVPAIIPALVIHALNNYESLKDNQGLLYYIPKIETPEEAKLVGNLLKTLETEMAIPRGSIKIEMLHERAQFTANQELIMWVLRENLIGPNVGRWDYINSLIEMHKDSGKTYMDPHRFGMTSPQLNAYTRRNALLTVMVGGFPVGGMSALMKNNSATDEENKKAVTDIWFDKLRERLTGLIVINGTEHDSYRQSWVATTEAAYVQAGAEPLTSNRSDLQKLVDRCSDTQKTTLKNLGLTDAENKISPLKLTPTDLSVDLLWSDKAWVEIAAVAEGEITEEGLRYAIYMASEYMFQQLNGNNAAAINIREGDDKAIRLMNDFATYEIFWHWLWTALHNRAALTQNGKISKKGDRVTVALVRSLLAERTASVKTYFDSHPVKPGTPAVEWDRSLAWVVMDVLERQLLSDRWIPYGSRVLLSLIEKTQEDREQLLSALFSRSRQEVEHGVENRFLGSSALRAHDYVYDSFQTDMSYEKQVKQKTAEVEAEWKAQLLDGRTLKRLHNAKQVAELRLNRPDRPAYRVQNAMAKKMRAILLRHQAAGTAVKTLGFADEFSIEAAARAGIEISYNGGWLESARAGTSDQARYPYSYLAETISRYSRHLQQHARHNPELAEKFLMPMFIDIDTGHMAPKEMVEYVMTYGTDAPLIGAVHIEDQAHGAKKCGHMAGKVLTSTEEHIKRLNNVRLQLDVMGLDTLVVARTDAEAAEFINSIHDKRDHPFLLGATNPDVGPYHTTIANARDKGATEKEVSEIHKAWKKNAALMTLAEAVGSAIKDEKVKKEWTAFAAGASCEEAKSKAKTWGIFVWSYAEWKLLKAMNQFPSGGTHIMWDYDLPGTEESGYSLYMIKSGVEMAIARSKSFLPYADISWMEQHHPDLNQTKQWANALIMHAKNLKLAAPLLGNNTSPSFYWRGQHDGHRLTDKELESFLDDQGAVVQIEFITYGGSELNHRNMERFLNGPEGFLSKGMLAWANFQDEALQNGNAFLQNSQSFAGVQWNEKRDVAGNGSTLVASAVGERNTMNQFKA